MDRNRALVILDGLWLEAHARINNASRSMALTEQEKLDAIRKAEDEQLALDMAIIALDPRHVRRA